MRFSTDAQVAASSDDGRMEDGEEQARPRDEGDRERSAIRREERELVAEERPFERGLEALEEDEHRVERQIDAEWRKEHWGHEPEHPPSWADNGERRPPGEGGDA